MDYASIKLDDPGGTVADALSALESMTVARSLSERFVTVKTVAASYGMAAAESIRAKIEANTPSVFPAWVLEAFGPNGSGLDVCATATQSEIEAATIAGIFTEDDRDNLLSLASEIIPKYPGLRAGDVEYARTL